MNETGLRGPPRFSDVIQSVMGSLILQMLCYKHTLTMVADLRLRRTESRDGS